MSSLSHITDTLHKRLTHYFVSRGILSQSVATEMIIQAKHHGLSVITFIAMKKHVSGKILAEACSAIFSLPIQTLAEISPTTHLISLLPSRLIHQFKLVPLRQIDKILEIGIVDPTDSSLLDAIAFQTHLTVRAKIIAYDDFEKWLETHHICETPNSEELIQKIDTDLEIHFDPDEALLEQDEPLIQLVNDIIVRARQRHASDIHIEPFEKICRIRYRLHGVLHTTNEIPSRLAARITTRLKILAKLDIAERRLPQDGRFRFQQTDIRINICPVLHGEKIVLRLLNSTDKPPTIDDIGMDIHQRQLFEKAITQPQGLILVTGPTGSGKTITLYAALSYLNHIEKNISTIEDPVEIHLTGINQTHIHPRIGLTFSKVLRALLRQDPDIIMIGEIRDPETAEIAIQAAQTGHLVLSTLHTNSTLETLSRLQSMDIMPASLAHSTRLIIAQRLIRILCLQCRIIDPDNSETYRAVGCEKCHAGYTGRTALYEMLPITAELRDHIQTKAPMSTLINIAKSNGFTSLFDAGMQKVQQGVTSFNELKRVLEI